MPEESSSEMIELATAKDNPGNINSGVSGVSNMGAIGDAGKIIPPPKVKELNFERGVTFSFPFSTQYQDTWEVYKTDKVTIRQLEVMRRTDGQARALYYLITMPIRAALKTATIVPADGQLGGSDEADFIDLMLHLPPAAGGMVIPLDQMMDQMLLGTFHGFSAFELVYWVPKKGPLAGKIALRKAAWRPPETVNFLINDQMEFAGFRQRTYIHGQYVDVKIPDTTAMVYTCNAAESPLWGVSMFEAAFYHYDKKVKLYYLAHIAAQRGAVGTRIGTMPPNPNHADKENFIKGLSQLGVNSYMAVPIDWTVTSMQETGTFDFLSYINHHNNQMSKSILAGFFDDDTGSGPSDSTVVDFSQQDDSLYIQLLQTIMNDTASVINNQLIPRFVDWNFGTEKYPTFHWGPFTDQQKAAIQTTFNILAAAGTNITVSEQFLHALEVHMANELGLPVDYDSLQKIWDTQLGQTQKLSDVNYQQELATAKQALTATNNPTLPTPTPKSGDTPTPPTTPEQMPTPPASPSSGGGSSAGGYTQSAPSNKPNTGNPNPNPPPASQSPVVKP
jgi:hypothetical protein